MPNTEFLEQYPLYRKFEQKFYDTLDRIPKVAVHMACPACQTTQTFVMANEYHEGYSYANVEPAGATCHLRYICTSCRKGVRHFYVQFGPSAEYVLKIGQHPAWSVALDRNLERALGKWSDLYKKGLVCESQAYGVGAFAYYRRIVEQVIDQLLEDISTLIPEADRNAYSAALAQTKATRVAQDKIALVKDLLPPILRPDGMNPLGVLHEALSAGLHAGTDEECAALAAEVREVLVFLVGQVVATRESAKSFTASMRKLLDRGKSA